MEIAKIYLPEWTDGFIIRRFEESINAIKEDFNKEVSIFISGNDFRLLGFGNSVLALQRLFSGEDKKYNGEHLSKLKAELRDVLEEMKSFERDKENIIDEIRKVDKKFDYEYDL